MQRDFTYIDDIAEGVIRCLDKPASVDPDFDPLHPDPATAAVPHRLFNIGNSQPMQPGDVLATAADTSALEAWVDFRPSTSIETGVARFAAWYRQHTRS
jgi:UDP-glucuronate 4-epimerase